MRLNERQLSKLVSSIVGRLIESGAISARDTVVCEEVIRNIIGADMKVEAEIEKEAEMLIKKHTANIHADELDYELLFKRAKIELAKKKGFAL